MTEIQVFPWRMHLLRSPLFSINRLLPLLLGGFVSFSTCLAESPNPKVSTPLDAYVAALDSRFGYKIEKSIKSATHTTHVVRMRSQSWLTKEEVDRTVWEHDLTIVVPSAVTSATGLLMIGGGTNGKRPPSSAEEELVKVALATKSVVTELGQVPNQPLRFADDPEEENRVEDAIIAYSWRKYLEGGKVEWLAQLPMTKSAVRAMDVISKVCQESAKVTVKEFVVTGGSKRGWTTWLTAAVDPRVKAIIPVVIDMLNVRPSFKHHYQAYGFFAPAVDDYVREGIMDWQDTERYAELLKVVEPYEYRKRLTMPKLLVNACSDQFFLPDSSQFYFDDLLGEKYLRYVPNAGHSLSGSDAYETLLAYYAMILGEVARPEFSWESTNAETISLKVKDKPSSVRLWQVTNEEARDFRKEVVGQTWTSQEIASSDGLSYTGTVKTPGKGWTAFMLELTYDTPAGVPLKLTTQVQVTPKELPFPPYEPKKK